MTSNVANKTRFSKFQKHKLGAEILKNSLQPKQPVRIIEAFLYPTYVHAFYLQGDDQIRCKIGLEALETFIRSHFYGLPKSEQMDMNMAIYLEENLKAICASYLEAGKDIIKTCF
jgi:hypothetical protein